MSLRRQCASRLPGTARWSAGTSSLPLAASDDTGVPGSSSSRTATLSERPPQSLQRPLEQQEVERRGHARGSRMGRGRELGYFESGHDHRRQRKLGKAPEETLDIISEPGRARPRGAIPGASSVRHTQNRSCRTISVIVASTISSISLDFHPDHGVGGNVDVALKTTDRVLPRSGSPRARIHRIEAEAVAVGELAGSVGVDARLAPLDLGSGRFRPTGASRRERSPRPARTSRSHSHP
jgi:hypothetical protein